MALTNDVMDAVNIVGGVKAVARKLGVPEAFVEEWMAKGTMENATRERVVRLSCLSGISPQLLAPPDS
jgi:DNA-binding transcriptional regulator YdaS (Cro superfamily)